MKNNKKQQTTIAPTHRLNHLLRSACILLFSMAVSAPADIVHLKNGGSAEGTITRQGQTIKVEFHGGVITVNADDVVRIEKKPLPEEIFAGQIQRVSSDADACVRLARWALSKYLDREYVQALRMALLADHTHREARRLLREYKVYHTNLPNNDSAAEKMLDDLGDGFYFLRTDHYRICYNTADIFAEVTGERLEVLYRQFMGFFEERSFEPTPLTDRLEVVLFDSPQQYHAYAKTISDKMTHSDGFYSSKTRRSYFYDSISESNTKYKDINEDLIAQLKKVKKTRQSILNKQDEHLIYTFTDSSGKQEKLTPSQALRKMDQQVLRVRREFDKLRNFYSNQNISITIHEGTHQLAYTCGIHSRYYNNPKWLIEGLATYFEPPNSNGWDAPGMPNHKFLKQIADENSDANKISLEELISRDEIFSLDTKKTANSYPAAWSLFYYLCKYRHETLFDYIYEMALRASNKPYQAKERIKDFEKYFGNIEQVESQWRLYMADEARELLP